jgi:hypothetical protein
MPQVEHSLCEEWSRNTRKGSGKTAFIRVFRLFRGYPGLLSVPFPRILRIQRLTQPLQVHSEGGKAVIKGDAETLKR